MDKLPTTGTGCTITQFRSVLLPPDSIRCKAKSMNHINKQIVQWNRTSVLKRIVCILYLNTTGIKAQSFWGCVQIKLNQMQVFEEAKTGVPGEKPFRAEKRTNKLNPHMTPSLGIKLRPHWWEASALTNTPPPLKRSS